MHGTVDLVSASAFRDDVLRRVGAAETSFVVDLCDVDFFSATAVNALVAGLKVATTARHQFIVRVAEGTLPHRVLGICGIRYQLA